MRVIQIELPEATPDDAVDSLFKLCDSAAKLALVDSPLRAKVTVGSLNSSL